MFDVRFGSLADNAAIPTDVRLPPKVDIHCVGRNSALCQKQTFPELVDCGSATA
jgi:hypothetical protein